jgi:predicted N-acetyltransferase YhbS
LRIRAERKEDYSGITEVTDLAFRQKNKGRLIVGLRRNPDFIPELSLVAEIGNEIIGHIFFSR